MKTSIGAASNFPSSSSTRRWTSNAMNACRSSARTMSCSSSFTTGCRENCLRSATCRWRACGGRRANPVRSDVWVPTANLLAVAIPLPHPCCIRNRLSFWRVMSARYTRPENNCWTSQQWHPERTYLAVSLPFCGGLASSAFGSAGATVGRWLCGRFWGRQLVSGFRWFDRWRYFLFAGRYFGGRLRRLRGGFFWPRAGVDQQIAGPEERMVGGGWVAGFRWNV